MSEAGIVIERGERKVLENLQQSGRRWAEAHQDEFDVIVSVGSRCIDTVLQRRSYWYELFEFTPVDEGYVPPTTQADSIIITAVETVDRLVREGKRVLVHCDAGVCRSVAVCAAVLVRRGEAPTFKSALQRLESHVPDRNTLIVQMTRISRERWDEL